MWRVSSDPTEVCGEMYHCLSCAGHSKSLFNVGHWFCIWLSLSELFPTSFCCPSIESHGAMGWYWCCWYRGADPACDSDVLPLFDIGNPWFSFIWAVTTHSSAHPSSFSIPDSGSWFSCFSDPLFSWQWLILDFKLFEVWVWEVSDKSVVIFGPMECNQSCFPFRWVIYNDLRVCASERPPKDLGYIYFYHRIPS